MHESLVVVDIEMSPAQYHRRLRMPSGLVGGHTQFTGRDAITIANGREKWREGRFCARNRSGRTLIDTPPLTESLRCANSGEGFFATRFMKTFVFGTSSSMIARDSIYIVHR